MCCLPVMAPVDMYVPGSDGVQKVLYSTWVSQPCAQPSNSILGIRYGISICTKAKAKLRYIFFPGFC